MGSKKISFRTIHDHVEVSEIAAVYGGGGHQKAAGCNLTEETYQIFVQNTFQLDPMPQDAKYNRYNVKESSFGTMYADADDNNYFI